jgi:hypothetical protein
MGAIENIITELIIRAAKHEAYAGVRPAVPSRRNERMTYAKRLCDAPGPLQKCGPLILQTIARFEGGLELRDILAHGRMQVVSNPGHFVIKLGDYFAHGDAIAYRVLELAGSDLELYANRMARTSRAVDWLYSRTTDLLPAIEGAYQGSTDMGGGHR